ncbi:hypothetical protein V6N13_086912 [Hibiscus sabdariffa]
MGWIDSPEISPRISAADQHYGSRKKSYPTNVKVLNLWTQVNLVLVAWYQYLRVEAEQLSCVVPFWCGFCTIHDV